MRTPSITDAAEVAGMLWQKGWAERNGGNIVVNVTDELTDEEKSEGCFFYCKGTGKRIL